MANKYWVGGHAGTGKSAIVKELERQGYKAVDGDKVPGLAAWVNKSGRKVRIDSPKFVDHSKVDWLWDGLVLEKLLKQPGELFFCGSSGNDIDFFDLFDKVFILTIDPETQRQRLIDREDNYGKDPRMHCVITDEQAFFARKMRAKGAISIDSTLPLNKVVDKILEAAHEN